MEIKTFKNQTNTFEVFTNWICVKKRNDLTGDLINKTLFSDYADARKFFNKKGI